MKLHSHQEQETGYRQINKPTTLSKNEARLLVVDVNFKSNRTNRLPRTILESVDAIRLGKNKFHINGGHVANISRVYPLPSKDIRLVANPNKDNPTPNIYAVLDIKRLAAYCKDNPEQMISALHIVSEQLKNDITGVKTARMMLPYTQGDDHKECQSTVRRRMKDVKVNSTALIILIDTASSEERRINVLNLNANQDLLERIKSYLKAVEELLKPNNDED